MIAKSQVIDYQLRGSELQDYNLLDFFVGTYETEITKSDHEKELSGGDNHRGLGRLCNTRVRYLSDHPKATTIHRIIRSHGHHNLPNFVGCWFPRNDDPEISDYYAASMLLLLKPWRDLEKDLKSPNETWALAFKAFRTMAPDRVLRTLSGIQYFHECALTAEQDTSSSVFIGTNEDDKDETALEDGQYSEIGHGETLSEEGLALLKAEAIPLREEIHRRMAIEAARHIGIFCNEETAWSITGEVGPTNATSEVMRKVISWTTLLSQSDSESAKGPANTSPNNSPGGTIKRSSNNAGPVNATIFLTPNMTDPEQALLPVDIQSLKPDQLRAYQIVNWHLEKTNAGEYPPPLQMILYGEGGTGKSRVIQTITAVFAHYNASHMLVKAAYTGVAASLIGGKTTHVIGGLSLNSAGAVTDVVK